MAGQKTKFSNNESDPPKFPTTHLSSTQPQIARENASDEVYGAGCHGSVGKIAEHSERQFLSARSRLKTLSQFAREAELSASIIHQINQPLATMLANAQAAKRWLAEDPPNLREVVASIDRIVRDARAADDAMTRIRAIFIQKPLDKKEASLIGILSDAVRLVLEANGEHKVEIKWHCDENLPGVYVDSLALQELFVNLISNALEALKETMSPTIELRVSATDVGEVLIQVIDNGPGIRDTEAIFDAFVTTKDTGLGIGLTLSRAIARAHDGSLWAESNPSGGATFWLALPLSPTKQESGLNS